MKLKNVVFINKNLKTSIKKIYTYLSKNGNHRYCFHNKSSKNGQFMIISRAKGQSFKDKTHCNSSLWLIIKGKMRFIYKNKNLLLKENDFVFLKKNIIYENHIVKDAIFIEFKSSRI